MNVVLKTECLSKDFGSTRAVDDLSIELNRGTITALLGGNGAGKTTTLSMLLGLLLPTSGKITTFGYDFVKDRYPALSRMNFSSPYVDLPQRLTVRENLTVYAKLYGLKNIKNTVQEMVETFRLEDFIDRRVRKLSAGQKTRVSLAKALINHPELLLLDEPTASLDPVTVAWIREFLKNYQEERKATILLASHDMKEVEQLCENVLLLSRGKLVEEGSPQDLLRKYDRKTLEEVFLDVSGGKEE
ncbi:MAG: ABC transporter ATP-binding protein [Opitutae bacterium]|jgi:ABC-2 type transport system ATP-binding protein|nr:ABC transporter ATP-binding protein [Opitutae bacterium]